MNIRTLLAASLAFGGVLVGAPVARSMGFIQPGFSGITSYDGWGKLTASNHPGYPTVSNGLDAWPSAIDSIFTGSGDAVYLKTAGLGFPSDGGGIYALTLAVFGPGYAGPTSGSFSVTDSTPVAGLGTVLFQIRIAGISNDFFSAPVLNYNGVSQALAPDYSLNLSTTVTPGSPGGGSIYDKVFAFQWDLSGAGPINDFEVAWEGPLHSLTYVIQLDQSSVFAQAVPEPSAKMALLLAGLGAALLGRRGVARRGLGRRS